MFLAARKLQTAIAHFGVVAERLRSDVVVDVGDLACLFDVLERCVLVRIAQVLEDRAVEQVRFLCDDADLATQVCEVEVAHIDTCRRFQHMDGLLQRFHDGIVFIGRFQREIATFHNSDRFAFRDADE